MQKFLLDFCAIARFASRERETGLVRGKMAKGNKNICCLSEAKDNRRKALRTHLPFFKCLTPQEKKKYRTERKTLDFSSFFLRP
ncbi:hypothetical protein CEXT_785481 [Caerostris extrusa]|uniref:Uncharacterized protein n=1 Tax=Caerostris extrusa TaxID=172846 RepID=A0AAV4T6I8_CAEEX|nr:hypothetical protein CEXT_785481 [Caerostris extrusa]